MIRRISSEVAPQLDNSPLLQEQDDGSRSHSPSPTSPADHAFVASQSSNVETQEQSLRPPSAPPTVSPVPPSVPPPKPLDLEALVQEAKVLITVRKARLKEARTKLAALESTLPIKTIAELQEQRPGLGIHVLARPCFFVVNNHLSCQFGVVRHLNDETLLMILGERPVEDLRPVIEGDLARQLDALLHPQVSPDPGLGGDPVG